MSALSSKLLDIEKKFEQASILAQIHTRKSMPVKQGASQ